MKTRIVVFGMILTLLSVSCSKKEDSTESNITTDEIGVSAKLDIMNDDVSKMVEDNIGTEDGIAGKSNQTAQPYSSCAYITRVPDFGTVITPGTLITKTIDFSYNNPSGCTLPNGNVLKGKIIITFTYDPTATSHTITYTFDNFYHNAVKLAGTKTFTRVMSVATATSPSHPIVTMNMDMTATFPNGNIYTRTGSRVREIIAGYDTPQLWSDNVYQVTGSWTTTFPNAASQSSTITSPLIVKLDCNHIVQGVISITRNNNTSTLDYGSGNCDNIAIFTRNGVSYTIILGN
jgi:hypothetical protein